MLKKDEILHEYTDVVYRIRKKWGKNTSMHDRCFDIKVPRKRVFYVGVKYLQRMYFAHYQKRNITVSEFIRFVADGFNREFRRELYGLDPIDLNKYEGTIMEKFFQLVEDTINNNAITEINETRALEDREYLNRYREFRRYVEGRYWKRGDYICA